MAIEQPSVASSVRAEPAPAHAVRLRRGWWAGARRVLRAAFITGVAIVGAAVVSGLSIDLGPSLRDQAERAGSRQIERPLHIGRLSVRLLTGDFLVEDLIIDGLEPGHRPFLSAGEVVLDIPWWSVFRRDLVIRSVDLRDWSMLVETFENGRHNFPRFTSGRPREGPPLITTTVQAVRATRGQFAYEDHDGATWSIVAPNIDITMTRLVQYRGQASFSDGSVRILSYEPMWAHMNCSFTIDKGRVLIDAMELHTDGAVSQVEGEVDLGNWPEQLHRVRSVVQFPRMREIFWPDRAFTLAGEGNFDGTFHLFKGGHELEGRFESADAGLDQFRFPGLAGQVRWTSDRLEVTDTTAGFGGGRAALRFSMMPLGLPTPGTASFSATYENVDLTELTHTLDLRGLRLAGQASGRNLLEWPLGEGGGLDRRSGGGEIVVTPPAGVGVHGATLEARVGPEPTGPVEATGEFDRVPLRAPLPIGGRVAYRFDPEWITVEPSAVASPGTYVAFEGRTAYGAASRIPFHVTSADWQESDRILAAIMTAFGANTGAVPFGGRGTFDGVMLDDFKRPRVEGRFSGRSVMAWDIVWGSVEAGVAIEDAYATITDGVITDSDSRMEVDGKFSLGFPRPDGGEELNARVRLADRPVVDLRHAFELDDYPVDGRLSGEFHVYGRYQAPLGFGRATVSPGEAYRERFDRATAGVRLEGDGVRFDGLEMTKDSGVVTGAAYVGFDGTYSFEAAGRSLPVESIDAVRRSGVPISGTFRFSAFGKGRFDNPRYDVRGAIEDVFLADEGVGQVTGRLSIRDNALIVEQLDAASPRLTASGAGRIALTDEAEADFSIRFSDTSLDPYARIYQPGLSPFTTAVASGTIRVRGPLAAAEQLTADVAIERLDLRLFDYALANDGAIDLRMGEGVVRAARLRLAGESTQLDVAGEIRLADEELDLRARGDANLGILQGFLRDIRSRGSASLETEITGTLSRPVIGGRLSIENGRLRHFALPHSIDELNGQVAFNAGGVSFEGLTGSLGGGHVQFGGSVLFEGFFPNEFSLTANGTDMRLRYPEGFRSIVDADLALRGPVAEPVLGGTVLVRDATWVKAFDSGGSMFDFGGGTGDGTGTGAAPPTGGESVFPVRFDLRIEAPSALRIETGTTRLVSSASFTLGGTYDRPRLLGRAEIERGDLLFEGHRYLVTRGTIDFTNPDAIEPFLDVEAETRARVPGETYRVTFRVTGPPNRLAFDVASDPPLPVVDILGLLFGDTRNIQDAELRALRSPEYAQQELVAARAARLLASPLSSGVGRAVEEALGVDSVQITPSLGDISAQQLSRLSPGARLTLSKRISERMLLTLSRTLTSSAPEQVILLEYNQSGRLSWVFTQNEDRTYAVDVRVRRVF
jgi:hypothetical protein